MPYQAAEESSVFGYVAHLKLKEVQTILESSKSFKEPFLGWLFFEGTASVLFVSVGTTFHDDAPLGSIEDLHDSGCDRRMDEHR